MTFVKGASTWANIASDLTKLACGEMADGSGVTVATADRWVREYDTSVDAIRSHASKDVGLPQCSMRVGYWAAISGGANGVGLSTFIQQTAVFGTKPAWVGATGRWAYRLIVNVANTTPGDYSTANIRYYAWDMDSGNYQYNGSSVAPAANGSITLEGMTFKVGDPSGTLTVGAEFIRMFTLTYMGGIDFWPMWSRRSGTATFGTNPPGTQATDWDIAEVAPPWGYSSQNFSIASASSWAWTPCWGSGLGVKTNTALTGAVYTVAFSVALHKMRIAQSANAGTLRMDYGRFVLDSGTYRRTSGFGTASWLAAFQTPAQVTSAAVINYWMVVKPDCIIVVLSGDPGLSGKVGCAHVSTFTPYDTTYDVLPVMFNQGVNDYSASNNIWTPMDTNKTQYNYWAMRRRQDGTEGTRDWQTKWMRSDMFESGATWSGMSGVDDQGVAQTTYMWGQHFNPNSSGNGRPSIVPVRQLKPHPIDNKWWLYSLPIGDSDPFTNYTTPANPGTMDFRFVRGLVNNRWWWLPGDGWANLDELTDNSTSQKYLLVAADYHGFGARMYIGGGYTGGVAIAEV